MAERMRASCSGSVELQRLRHALEVGLGDLLAELLHELLEALPGLGRDEVVVLEALDLARQVLGQEVEGHPPLGGDVGGHLGAALVAGVPGLLLELVDGGALLVDHLVEAPG